MKSNYLARQYKLLDDGEKKGFTVETIKVAIKRNGDLKDEEKHQGSKSHHVEIAGVEILKESDGVESSSLADSGNEENVHFEVIEGRKLAK